MKSFKNAFPWMLLVAILLGGLFFVMPGIVDQVQYKEQCATKGGVFTMNGKCVEEIYIERGV